MALLVTVLDLQVRGPQNLLQVSILKTDTMQDSYSLLSPWPKGSERGGNCPGRVRHPSSVPRWLTTVLNSSRRSDP